MKAKRILKWALIALAALILIMAVGFFIYTGNSYPASDEAIASLSEEHEGYSIYKDQENLIFAPEQPIAGLIFYPGGSVEYEAYAPLMETFADAGVLCVLVKMPKNLAIFDVNAADGIQDAFPEIQEWYIGGHSLGGAMAGQYLADDHANEYDGALLLAAYSASDLSDTDLKVMSVYGTEDGVLDLEKVTKYSCNLPEETVVDPIAGGCHSYFGDYGMQEGDGTPTITRQEQMEQSAEALLELINEG